MFKQATVALCVSAALLASGAALAAKGDSVAKVGFTSKGRASMGPGPATPAGTEVIIDVPVSGDTVFECFESGNTTLEVNLGVGAVVTGMGARAT